ncbi:hypothetical protein [Sulfurivirga sp.]|uniref:hypothetical protein n=1 Tax=Sulfurivirga sp. TaxID=2614236 RepID=UPI0025D1DB2F|nr:hypothetical protein [Sulfurivirga sp.]
MSLENTLNQAIGAINGLRQTVDGKIADIDARVNAAQAQVDGFINNARAEFPLAPNLLRDTYQFTGLCGGQVNTPVDIVTAHGAPWGCAWNNGGSGTGTIEVVTNDQFAAKGIGWGGDMALACSSNFYGASFRAVLLDISFATSGRFLFMTQGCPVFTGWGHGQFRTQASALVNVLSATGNIVCKVMDNAAPTLSADASLVGQGWKYLHAAKMGFGGCCYPAFVGDAGSSMRIAIALPYWGTGDHGSNFIYARNGGAHRYTHEEI